MEKLAGYAEFWQWDDGNTTPEERHAYFVQVTNGKIEYAVGNSDVIGVTIASPISGDTNRNTGLIIGNQAETDWPTHYLEDEFGNIQTYASNLAGITSFMQSIDAAIPENNDYDNMTMANVRLDLIDVVTTVMTERYQNNYGDPLPPEAQTLLDDAIDNLTTVINQLEPLTVPIVNPSYNPNATYTPRSADPAWIPVVELGTVVVRDGGTCTVGSYCDCQNGEAVPGSAWRVLSRVGTNTIRILYK